MKKLILIFFLLIVIFVKADVVRVCISENPAIFLKYLLDKPSLSQVEKGALEEQVKTWKMMGATEESAKAVGNFDDFFTVGGKVKKAGNKSDMFTSFTDNTKVPSRYTVDENRFNALATDNATGVNKIDVKTRREAMAGLEAEQQGLIKGPITRELTGDFEFIDADGKYWDVKSPTGKFFDVNSIGKSVKDQLIVPNVKVIIDCSYISDIQLINLRDWLNSNLSMQQLNRIIEVNTNFF